jgi:hypothetical protein
MKSGIGIEGRKEEVYTKKLSGKLEIDWYNISCEDQVKLHYISQKKKKKKENASFMI